MPRMTPAQRRKGAYLVACRGFAAEATRRLVPTVKPMDLDRAEALLREFVRSGLPRAVVNVNPKSFEPGFDYSMLAHALAREFVPHRWAGPENVALEVRKRLVLVQDGEYVELAWRAE